MNDTYIYKILLPFEWEGFKTTGQFSGAAIDVKDGYIHFSTAAQTGETANKHFKSAPSIIIAEVQTCALGDALKYEVSRNNALFPHLYADLKMDAVTRHWDLKRGAGGAYVMPDFSQLEA